jgi:hypothetical protein
VRWMQALVEVANGEVVAIDGKTLRRSFDRAEGLGAIHRVSAWAKRNQGKRVIFIVETTR